MQKKLILITAIFLMSIGLVSAQDPSLVNQLLNPNPLEENGTGTATFYIGNNTTAIPTATEIEISVGFGRIEPTGPPTGAGADLFTWTYLAFANQYQGTQIADIPAAPYFGEITFAVDVTGTSGQSGGFNANLQNLGALVPGSNVTGNDQVAIFVPIADDPLPVELLSFTGRKVEDGNLLEWVTASEENNEGFEVQESTDGENWDVIGWVEGKGTTSELNTYEFLDRVPFIGDNYYRLKQIDYDGQFEFSNIINLKYESKDIVIEVLPNPSPGDVKITVMNPDKEKMNITMYDSAGVLIWKSGAITNTEVWKKQFNLVQKEAYFITVHIGKKTFTEKILIINRA